MADSFSPLLNLRLQQTGGNDNTWGDLLNTDALTPLENAIAGRLDVSVASGGSIDLSATPIQHQVIYFTGVMTADVTVTIPNLTKRLLLVGAATGAFAVLVKPATGSTIRIPYDTAKDVFCNGQGSLLRGDRSDVGEMKYFGNSTVPSGFLECDGSAISRANYPDLFAAIGTTWGVGNGATTFNLPDFKTAGRFLRSRTGSVAVGTLQAADIAAHNHTASGSVSGSVSLSIAADGAHTPSISISDPTHIHNLNCGITNLQIGGVSSLIAGGGPVTTAGAATGVTASSSSIGNHSHAGSSASFSGSISVTVNNSSGTETRPINASALSCIRY